MSEFPKGKRIVGKDRASLSKDLVKQYKSGTSIRTMAQETGRSYGFVHRVLKDAGVEFRSRGGATRGKK